MSTRAQVFFHNQFKPDEIVAGVYHHGDGYPDYMVPSLLAALKSYKEAAGKTGGFQYRVDEIDTTDFAAWYVMLEKPHYAHYSNGVGGVYIDQQRHGDLAYEYHVSFRPGGDLEVEIRNLSDASQNDKGPLLGYFADYYPATEEQSLFDAMLAVVRKAEGDES